MEDLFCEVDHGPYLIDNNIFLSEVGFLRLSEGGAFVHNLIAGKLVRSPINEQLLIINLIQQNL